MALSFWTAQKRFPDACFTCALCTSGAIAQMHRQTCKTWARRRSYEIAWGVFEEGEFSIGPLPLLVLIPTPYPVPGTRYYTYVSSLTIYTLMYWNRYTIPLSQDSSSSRGATKQLYGRYATGGGDVETPSGLASLSSVCLHDSRMLHLLLFIVISSNSCRLYYCQHFSSQNM